MMDRRAVHEVALPQGYIPEPYRHMVNVRDYGHFIMALKCLESFGGKTVLDIGAYDGWLDFLLIDRGYSMTGVEFIQPLAEAARRFAARNQIDYTMIVGAAQDQMFGHKEFDAVICYETLEHMSADEALACTYRFGDWASHVLISLPDQSHRDNPQHCWTPTKDLLDLWFRDRGAKIEYKDWPGTGIPANWFIAYDTP